MADKDQAEPSDGLGSIPGRISTFFLFSSGSSCESCGQRGVDLLRHQPPGHSLCCIFRRQTDPLASWQSLSRHSLRNRASDQRTTPARSNNKGNLTPATQLESFLRSLSLSPPG